MIFILRVEGIDGGIFSLRLEGFAFNQSWFNKRPYGALARQLTVMTAINAGAFDQW